MKIDMTARFTLALLLMAVVVKAENPADLKWSAHALQISAQRNNTHAGVPTALSVRPGTSQLAIVGDDHVVRIQDRKTGKLITILETHSDWIKTAKFHPDAQTLLTAGADRKIMIWNAENHHRFDRFATEDRAITDLDIDRSGKWLATVGFSSKLHLYHFKERKRVHTLECPDNDNRTVSFSPDGNSVAVGSRNGTIRLFSTDTGKQLDDFPAHHRRVRDIVFQSDGQKIISCSEDRTVRCIDLVTKKIETLVSAPAKFYSVVEIAAGKFAVGASDNLIRIIDLADRSETGFLEGHRGTVCCLCVDNGELISGSFDTQIKVWQVEGSWVHARRSENQSNRQLTDSQKGERNNEVASTTFPRVARYRNRFLSVEDQPDAEQAASRFSKLPSNQVPDPKGKSEPSDWLSSNNPDSDGRNGNPEAVSSSFPVAPVSGDLILRPLPESLTENLNTEK